MPEKRQHPQDPAEGSRKIVEHELKQQDEEKQGGGRKPADTARQDKPKQDGAKR